MRDERPIIINPEGSREAEEGLAKVFGIIFWAVMAIGIVDHTLTVAWKWGLSTVAALREDIRKGVEGDEGLPAATVPDRLDGKYRSNECRARSCRSAGYLRSVTASTRTVPRRKSGSLQR